MDEIIYKNKQGKTLIKIFKDNLIIDKELENKKETKEVSDEDAEGEILRGDGRDNSPGSTASKNKGRT